MCLLVVSFVYREMWTLFAFTLEFIVVFSLSVGMARHSLELSSWPFLSVAPLVGIFGWITLLSFVADSLPSLTDHVLGGLIEARKSDRGGAGINGTNDGNTSMNRRSFRPAQLGIDPIWGDVLSPRMLLPATITLALEAMAQQVEGPLLLTGVANSDRCDGVVHMAPESASARRGAGFAHVTLAQVAAGSNDPTWPPPRSTNPGQSVLLGAAAAAAVDARRSGSLAVAVRTRRVSVSNCGAAIIGSGGGPNETLIASDGNSVGSAPNWSASVPLRTT